MQTSKELLGEYVDALETLDETRKTCPSGRGAKLKSIRRWESVMRTVRSDVRQRLVAYVTALLHEDTVDRGELEKFVIDARLSTRLNPEPLAQLIAEVRELGFGGYRWIEGAITREMTTVSSLPLQAQAINLGGVIDIVVVRRGSDRRENVDRLTSRRSLV